eukprot:tig00000310_g23927.t1
MGWVDAVLTKVFGPKSAQPPPSFNLAAAISTTIERKNNELILKNDGKLPWADVAAGALGSTLTGIDRTGAAGVKVGQAVAAVPELAMKGWHYAKIAAGVAASPYPLEPGVKLERANAVSVKKAKRTLALEVPVAEDTEKVAFNKRKTYKAIREGQLLPTDSVPGLPGTTAGELLVRNLRLQYVSRLRRSKAKKARLDSGDSSSSS